MPGIEGEITILVFKQGIDERVFARDDAVGLLVCSGLGFVPCGDNGNKLIINGGFVGTCLTWALWLVR